MVTRQTVSVKLSENFTASPRLKYGIQKNEFEFIAFWRRFLISELPIISCSSPTSLKCSRRSEKKSQFLNKISIILTIRPKKMTVQLEIVLREVCSSQVVASHQAAKTSRFWVTFTHFEFLFEVFRHSLQRPLYSRPQERLIRCHQRILLLL